MTWGEPEFVESAKKALKSDEPVLVYCRSGRRSGLAMTALKEAGFTDIRSLDGGIVAWQDAGKPVIKGE